MALLHTHQMDSVCVSMYLHFMKHFLCFLGGTIVKDAFWIYVHASML